MKLLAVLFFVAVFALAWLFFRAKELTGSAIDAARETADGNRVSGGAIDFKTMEPRVHNNAVHSANCVSRAFPGATKSAYDFSLWSQQRFSSLFPGAVEPASLGTEDRKLTVAIFLGAAFIQSLTTASLTIADQATFTKLVQLTLRSTIGEEVGNAVVDVAVTWLVDETVPEDYEYARTEGQMDMMQWQKGYQSLPFENRLRDAMKT